MGENYDVMIIGGGTGGLRCSIIAAKNGYKTALIEGGKMGGTCLNTGCIPTKTLIHAADVYTEMMNCGELGLKAENVSIDFEKVMKRVHSIVNGGRKHAEKSVEEMEGLTHYNGYAKFVSENSVEVNGEEISADKIIISVGGKPWAPPFKGLEEVGALNNESALELKELPKSMILLGGGYISIELACFFAAMGTKVTVIERNPRILAMLDEDVTSFLNETMTKHGLDIRTSRDILELQGKNGEGVTVVTKTVDDENSEEVHVKADWLLVATGRRPNIKPLEPEKAKVNLTERGFVDVDEYCKTSNPNVYAFGDVHGKSPFAHTAKREAKLVLENALFDEENKVNYPVIPWAVFCRPTVGGVGLSEKQARDKGFDVGIMKANFSRTGKAKIINKPEGFVKVVYDKKTRNLLGCVIIGAEADNLIHEYALLLNTPDPKVDYVLETVHVHPTLAEVMGELKDVKG